MRKIIYLPAKEIEVGDDDPLNNGTVIEFKEKGGPIRGVVESTSVRGGPDVLGTTGLNVRVDHPTDKRWFREVSLGVGRTIKVISERLP